MNVPEAVPRRREQGKVICPCSAVSKFSVADTLALDGLSGSLGSAPGAICLYEGTPEHQDRELAGRYRRR